jgi:putative transposase
MRQINSSEHRFPPGIIRYGVYLHFSTLSFCDIEEILAERGIDVSCGTIHCRTIKFGPLIAWNLKRKRPPPSVRWHLDK